MSRPEEHTKSTINPGGDRRARCPEPERKSKERKQQKRARTSALNECKTADQTFSCKINSSRGSDVDPRASLRRSKVLLEKELKQH